MREPRIILTGSLPEGTDAAASVDGSTIYVRASLAGEDRERAVWKARQQASAVRAERKRLRRRRATIPGALAAFRALRHGVTRSAGTAVTAGAAAAIVTAGTAVLVLGHAHPRPMDWPAGHAVAAAAPAAHPAPTGVAPRHAGSGKPARPQGARAAAIPPGGGAGSVPAGGAPRVPPAGRRLIPPVHHVVTTVTHLLPRPVRRIVPKVAPVVKHLVPAVKHLVPPPLRRVVPRVTQAVAPVVRKVAHVVRKVIPVVRHLVHKVVPKVRLPLPGARRCLPVVGYVRRGLP